MNFFCYPTVCGRKQRKERGASHHVWSGCGTPCLKSHQIKWVLKKCTTGGDKKVHWKGVHGVLGSTQKLTLGQDIFGSKTFGGGENILGVIALCDYPALIHFPRYSIWPLWRQFNGMKSLFIFLSASLCGCEDNYILLMHVLNSNQSLKSQQFLLKGNRWYK